MKGDSYLLVCDLIKTSSRSNILECERLSRVESVWKEREGSGSGEPEQSGCKERADGEKQRDDALRQCCL